MSRKASRAGRRAHARGGSQACCAATPGWLILLPLPQGVVVSVGAFPGLLTFGFASALMFTSGYLVSASAVVETISFLLPLILRAHLRRVEAHPAITSSA